MDHDLDSSASARVCAALAREVESVELLLHRLEIHDVIQRNGPPRLLEQAMADLERALAVARRDELLTAVEVRALDLPSGGPTMPVHGDADLPARFPEPWNVVLAGRCHQLDAALAGIRRVLAAPDRADDGPVWPRLDTWLARRTRVGELIDLCPPPAGST